jgi:hypothetical protein
MGSLAGLFYKTACPIKHDDVMRAFYALWSLDGRSLYLLNQAYMVLLRKKKEATLITDYQGPLKTAGTKIELAGCATKFIKGRIIHDNFKAVELTAKCLHRLPPA